MALMGLALLAVTWTMRAEPVIPPQRSLISDALESNAKVAVWLLESKGQSELVAYLHRMERKARVRAMVFNATGHLVAGKAVGGAADLARQTARSTDVEFALSGVHILGAHRAAGRGGRIYVLVAAMPRGLLSALQVQPRTRIIRLFAVLCVAGIVCFGLAFYLADPVKKLRAATRRVAAGDLSVRVAPQLGRRRDELADLGRDFDAMAERLAALMGAQRRLLGDVSHELRTPLTRLNLALELARRHAGSDAAPALDRIEREAGQLNELIGQLLTLSRLETGDSASRTEPVNLCEIVREAAADAGLEAKNHCCSIRIVHLDECTIRGDGALLRSALENLLRNALHYAPENSAVEIELRCAEHHAQLSVRDFGPGVPEAHLQNIFRPFFRVDEARDRASGGAGLGLSIVERAITSHGGTVEARNAPGGGLIVTITLPQN